MLIKFGKKKKQEMLWVFLSIFLSALSLGGVVFVVFGGEPIVGNETVKIVSEEFVDVVKNGSACNVSLGLYVGDIIEIHGNVVEILDDYISSRGRVYQQFYVSDNCSNVLVFKNVGEKRVVVVVGQNITARGLMKLWNDEYELYNPEIIA